MEAFRLGARTVDLSAAAVRAAGETRRLTPIETELLRYLAARPGQVVGRDVLLTQVWGYRPGVASRTVDKTTVRLRAKIEDDPAEPRHLVALYGLGLRLDGVQPVSDRPELGFVGREPELARTRAFVTDGRRVVTVTGPAGVGKSRLAAEVLRGLPLPSVSVSAEDLPPTGGLDEALRVALGVDAEPVAALVGRGAMVVCVDGCEGALDAVRAAIVRWTGAAERLVVLATSQVPLDLPGEQLVPLGPMSASDASALLRLRMHEREARSPVDAQLTERLAAAVDHLPLGIELAAARAASADPAELAAELEATGIGGGMARAVDRAVARLAPAELVALAQISTFAAPFGLDDVVGVTGLPASAAVAHLDALTRRSLVRVGQGVRRYELLRVIRARARRELAPDDPAWMAHARWFASFGSPEALDRMGPMPGPHHPLRGASADLAAAFARAASVDAEVAARCGLALLWSAGADFWTLAERVLALGPSARVRDKVAIERCWRHLREGRHAEGLAEAEAASTSAEHPADRVELYVLIARHAAALGDGERERRALADAEPLLPAAGRAEVLWWRTAPQGAEPRELEQRLRRATRVARRYGDAESEATGLMNLAHHVLLPAGQIAEARKAYERAAALPLGEGIAGTLSHIRGLLELVVGDLDAAEALLEGSAATSRRLGTLDDELASRFALARIALARGDTASAELLAADVARTRRPTLARLVDVLRAEIALRAGDVARAADELRRALADSGGRWRRLDAEALDLLAVADRDPRHLDAADAIDDRAASRARRLALRALLAPEHARADALAAARAAIDALGLLPDSDARSWLARAER